MTPREKMMRIVWDHFMQSEDNRSMRGDAPDPTWDAFGETLNTTRSNGAVLTFYTISHNGVDVQAVFGIRRGSHWSSEVRDMIPADVLARANGGAA